MPTHPRWWAHLLSGFQAGEERVCAEGGTHAGFLLTWVVEGR